MRSFAHKRRRGSGRGLSAAQHRHGRRVVALAACAGYANLPDERRRRVPRRAQDTFTGRVTRVVDGDTFWISSPASASGCGASMPPRSTCRAGRRRRPRSPPDPGQQLTCRQRDIDRYGRIVGQCFLPDGRDITAAMIASGTAQEYCRYSGNHYRTC